jgi:hypothetical protein
LFEHCVLFGVQMPVQVPLTHADAAHATAVPHWPLAPHVSTPLPEHRFAPGVQTPVQAPATHAWFVHVEPFTQVPVESQL